MTACVTSMLHNERKRTVQELLFKASKIKILHGCWGEGWERKRRGEGGRGKGRGGRARVGCLPHQKRARTAAQTARMGRLRTSRRVSINVREGKDRSMKSRLEEGSVAIAPLPHTMI